MNDEQEKHVKAEAARLVRDYPDASVAELYQEHFLPACGHSETAQNIGWQALEDELQARQDLEDRLGALSIRAGISPYRDAHALALTWLDNDGERIAAVLAPYKLDSKTPDLLFAVLALVGVERDTDKFAELLYQVALTGAGREEGR